jgi:PQQ-dependent dehydrogenase (methanol/ethanol family)
MLLRGSFPAVAAVVATVLALATAACGVGRDSQAEWRLLGGNSDQTQHSEIGQIDTSNVGRLGLAWAADIPGGDGLVGNPLVADGVVYQSGRMGNIYANDLRSGRTLWTFTANFEPAENQSWVGFWSLQVNRGLAMDGDRLFLGFNCQIIAVDRKSGKQLWAAQSCDPTKAYGITGAPRVGGGKVFIGNTGGDRGADRGFVDAFDANSGKKLWRFYTMPGDPSKPFETPELAMAAKTWGTNYWQHSHGALSVWEAITYDEQTDMLYFGTDGPSPWSPAARAKDAGDELFSNSIIAVNATTGKYLWHYQTVQHDGWNLSATMHIMLAELPQKDGSTRRVVMSAPKNGFFFVLDAETGKFISAKNYTRVNWTKGIDQVTGRPIPSTDANYWEKPGQQVVMYPGDNGGHSWQLMAYNPALNLVFIPASSLPVTFMGNPADPVGGVAINYDYSVLPVSPEKAKGELIAWDPVTQTKKWSVDRKFPVNGGILSTSGNLVFQGIGEGKFQALDARDGRVLWSFDTGAVVLGAPSTVLVDGVQYILVPTGNGGSSGMRSLPRFINAMQLGAPSRLLAFRLDGNAPFVAHKPEPFPRPQLPKEPTALAARGQVAYNDAVCWACHGYNGIGSGPGIPDLRKLTREKYAALEQIVIQGAYRPSGMPAHPKLKQDDLKAIKAFLTNQAWEAHQQNPARD